MVMACQMVLNISVIITSRVTYGATIQCKMSIFVEMLQDCQQMPHILA